MNARIQANERPPRFSNAVVHVTDGEVWSIEHQQAPRFEVGRATPDLAQRIYEAEERLFVAANSGDAARAAAAQAAYEELCAQAVWLITSDPMAAVAHLADGRMEPISWMAEQAIYSVLTADEREAWTGKKDE
ncbi:hypothetical protein DFR29_102400 [Tahibacter aquaticus]|uniref:Uncharacterized protein n=1 Tax=Tahibacter aquaticus TaxID=520092 RepID=A0A4R6Z7F4_9GAMM|nr:hypothetical protein [Tahibacter aquaticus]TDR47740.1 hypothetical protein DFR29_102400 [Tahibacter aquaticus]